MTCVNRFRVMQGYRRWSATALARVMMESNNREARKGEIMDKPTRAPSTPTPTPGWRVGSLFGIDIFLDTSLLLIFALIVYMLWASVFPQWHPGWSGATRWLAAIAGVAGMFSGVGAPENSGPANAGSSRPANRGNSRGQAHSQDHVASPRPFYRAHTVRARGKS